MAVVRKLTEDGDGKGRKAKTPPTRRPARRTDEVGQWIQQLPEDFMLCRDLGHNWRPHRAWWAPADGCWRRIMRCPRCKAERTQDLSRTGLVLSGHYDYTDGYSKPQGSGYFSATQRAALRLESLLRTVDEDQQDAG